MSEPAEPQPIPFRTQAPVYALAFCFGNIMPMASVVMPLWALEMTASPFLIGLVISSRQFLVVTLSIYGGALLDRGQPHRVMILLAVVAALSFALFPLMPYIWAAILLQMICGFAETTNWIGVQAVFGRVLSGRALYAGRLTAVARTGGFIGPWMVGLVWQFFGPEGAFAMLALWVLMGAGAVMFLPRIEPPAPDEKPANEKPVNEEPAARPAAKAASLRPKLSDYATAFRLLVLPAVALVILATFMRQTGTGIQASFYGVWLKGIGFEAGTIGLLIGISSGASAISALAVGRLTRVVTDHWLLIAMIVMAIATIAITPLLNTYTLLVVAIVLRGVGQGLNLPLMMSIASRAVGPDLQGRVAALRITFNRLGGALVPLAMGAIAEVAGLENAFYVMGALGIASIGCLSIWVARSPSFRR